MTARRNWLVAAGICCILCPSAGMLLATAYNRSGSPESILSLSERELRLPADNDKAGEGRALAFGLVWRLEAMEHSDFAAQRLSSTPPLWMTLEKRAELGVNSADDLRWRSTVPAFLVLEFNGPAYARELERACRSDDRGVCDRVRNLESRLYVVDAGSDADVLRSKYTDRSTYAVVRGTVKFAGIPTDATLSACINGMDVETVQAMEPLRSARSQPAGEMSWHALGGEQPFVAAIAFGHRFEPWNLSVSVDARPKQPPLEPPINLRDGRIEIKPN
jgi:hypothetical protein